MNGTSISYHENGSRKAEFNYKNDVLEGATVIYGRNNEVAVILNFHKGELISYSYMGKDGKQVNPVAVKNGTAFITAYYPNGNKSAELNYESSTSNGPQKIYFSNGQLFSQYERVYGYNNGVAKTFFEDGKIAKEEDYVYDNFHGIIKEFYANGNLKSERSFYEGEENGVSKYYNETGKLTETRTHYFGVLLSVNKQ
jgi:antitoxin component YwqK of YwqJK toxin-antitoxin module